MYNTREYYINIYIHIFCVTVAKSRTCTVWVVKGPLSAEFLTTARNPMQQFPGLMLITVMKYAICL